MYVTKCVFCFSFGVDRDSGDKRLATRQLDKETRKDFVIFKLRKRPAEMEQFASWTLYLFVVVLNHLPHGKSAVVCLNCPSFLSLFRRICE